MHFHSNRVTETNSWGYSFVTDTFDCPEGLQSEYLPTAFAWFCLNESKQVRKFTSAIGPLANTEQIIKHCVQDRHIQIHFLKKLPFADLHQILVVKE